MFEFVFLLIAVFIVIFVVFAKGRRKTQLAWHSIARELGLAYFGTQKPSLTGLYENRSVRVRIFSEHNGNTTRTFTGFEVEYRKPIPVSFQLNRQGFIQDVFGKVGVTDIQVGDPQFDSAVLVKGHNEEEVRNFFQSERARNACLNVFRKSRYTKTTITNHKITVAVMGKLMTAFEIRTVLNQLLSVARLLEEEVAIQIPGAKEKVEPPPLPPREKAVAVPEEWHDPPVTDKEPVESIRGEVDNLFVENTTPEVEPVSAEPVAPWEAESPVDEVTVDEAEVSSVANSISIEDVAGELFEPKLGKYQSGKRFDELLKGENVDWSGHLHNIAPGSSDRFFGRDSGWIAVFDLGTFPGMESGTGPLQVKYRIGRKKYDEIKECQGDDLEIRGELVKFDPFTATLYVDSGDAKEEQPTSVGSTEIVSYAERLKKEMQSRPGEVRRFS